MLIDIPLRFNKHDLTYYGIVQGKCLIGANERPKRRQTLLLALISHQAHQQSRRANALRLAGLDLIPLALTSHHPTGPTSLVSPASHGSEVMALYSSSYTYTQKEG